MPIAASNAVPLPPPAPPASGSAPLPCAPPADPPPAAGRQARARGPRTARRQATSTLAGAWLDRAARSAHRTALVFDERRWSYAELHQAACVAARQLLARGLAPGERAMLMMDNGVSLVAAFIGCQLIGAVPIPVSPRSDVQQVRYLLEDSEAALLLLEPHATERVLAQHRAQAYAKRVLQLDEHGEPWQAVAPQAEAGDCAFIQYTAGCDAKGVMVSHRAALAGIDAFTSALGLAQRDVFSSMLPMCQHFGLVAMVLAPLLAGHTLVLHRSGPINLHAWLAGIARHRVTVSAAPESLLRMANRVVDEPLRHDLSSLRALICGQEPVGREGVETFGTRFGVLDALKPAYGLAEVASCATMMPPGEPVHIDDEGHVACGRPLRGVDICIAADDGLLTREAGVRGEIRLRSASVMSGYWMRSWADADAYDDGGWLRTGDVGYLDARGCLYVLGRAGDLLHVDRRRVSPHDLEAACHDVPAVQRAAVVQCARDEGRVIAVLEVARSLLRNEAELRDLSRQLRAAVRARVGFAPTECWFVAPGSLPCTALDQVRHRLLREWIAQGRFVPAWADGLRRPS